MITNPDLIDPNVPAGPWVALDIAFARIREKHVGRDVSLKIIRDALVAGELRSKANLIGGVRRGYVTEDTIMRETYLPPAVWKDTNFTLSTLNETVVQVVVYRLSLIGGQWYVYIHESDLNILLGVEIQQSKLANKKGGRPEEHSWWAAFAYLGWFISRNGLPETKNAAVELVKDWFVKNEGSAPKDDRALERRVAQAYDALARVQSAEGGSGEV
ncbi:hypothetical protein [Methylobacterium pseudosasicola]|uniref:Uncharacterized protein n=1 Tax=Methylobacterium pseudosasicola TaxID=582667 RepID=A0A1I4VEM4_9HYPH|nr:hypothetical protein [Methylobacterium pseudosasicola]SFM99609.1 hypothetical protein SAMN05192568_10973 [Methylobacterium pseudosasicola]